METAGSVAWWEALRKYVGDFLELFATFKRMAKRIASHEGPGQTQVGGRVRRAPRTAMPRQPGHLRTHSQGLSLGDLHVSRHTNCRSGSTPRMTLRMACNTFAHVRTTLRMAPRFT